MVAHDDGRVAVRDLRQAAEFLRGLAAQPAMREAGRVEQRRPVVADRDRRSRARWPAAPVAARPRPAPHNRSSGGGGNGMTQAARPFQACGKREEPRESAASCGGLTGAAHRGGLGPGRIAAAGPPGAARRGAVDDQREGAARARLDAGGHGRERLPVLVAARPAAAARAWRPRSRCRCRTAGRPRRACRRRRCARTPVSTTARACSTRSASRQPPDRSPSGSHRPRSASGVPALR